MLGVLNAVGVAVGAHQRNADRLMVCLLGRSGGVEPDLDVPAGHVDVFDERA